MFTTDLTAPFTTAELQVLRDVLQNETAWDRDADTGGFNSYHSADNHTRPGSGVLTPVHEEAEWKVLNSAMLRIDLELERRKQRQEKFDRLFPELPAYPANQTDQTGQTDQRDRRDRMKDVVHIPLEATHVQGRDYTVRPAGAWGTCGLIPVPWTVQYIEAGSPDEAIRKAKPILKVVGEST